MNTSQGVQFLTRPVRQQIKKYVKASSTDAEKRIPAKDALTGPIPVADKPNKRFREEERLTGLRVTYSKSIRRITLQRVLVSRLVHSLDIVSYAELLVLYDNQVWLEQKCEKDPKFAAKYGNFLKKLSSLLKKVRINPSTFKQTLLKLATELEVIGEGHLIPKRNLTHTEQFIKGKFHILLPKRPGVPVKELPPRRFIGIGYRDKGTRRDLAWDGSPDWKDIARYFSFLEEEQDNEGNKGP